MKVFSVLFNVVWTKLSTDVTSGSFQSVLCADRVRFEPTQRTIRFPYPQVKTHAWNHSTSMELSL